MTARYYHTGKWACMTAGDFQAFVCVYAVTASVYTELNMLIFFLPLFSCFHFTERILNQSVCVCVCVIEKSSERLTCQCSVAVLAITQSQPGAHH